MGFLRNVHGVTLRNKVRNCEISKVLKVEPLLHIARSQPLWVGHVSKISQHRLARQVLLATPTGKAAKSSPKDEVGDYTSDLAWSRLGVAPAELPRLLLIVRYFES